MGALGLIVAAIVWAFVVYVTDTGMTPSAMAMIVALSAGALMANVISVILLLIETVMLRR